VDVGRGKEIGRREVRGWEEGERDWEEGGVRVKREGEGDWEEGGEGGKRKEIGRREERGWEEERERVGGGRSEGRKGGRLGGERREGEKRGREREEGGGKGKRIIHIHIEAKSEGRWWEGKRVRRRDGGRGMEGERG